MQLIKSLSYSDLLLLNNKDIHFISDCEFFPNFDVFCHIDKILFNGSEYIFYTTILDTKRKLEIGSNMKNLQFEFIN